MKLISLNTWGGKLWEPLSSFIKEQAPSTDIFCFQEIAHTAPRDLQNADASVGDRQFNDLEALLPNHNGYFAATHEGFNWRSVTFDLSFGNAIFVHNKIKVLEEGHRFVHKEKNSHEMPEMLKGNWATLPRLIQHMYIDADGKEYTVCNFHGYWNQNGKGDTPERFEQSRKIIETLKGFTSPTILCGDFNINIDAEALKKIEAELSMRNLIKEFNIPTTRSKTYYPRIEAMPFADYTLVTSDIKIKNFSVPDLPISDHLPMILEFN